MFVPEYQLFASDGIPAEKYISAICFGTSDR
jgi:hypothetical protein